MTLTRTQRSKCLHLLQSIPRYVEVPPNIEATRIISCFSAVLSCYPNQLLLKVDSKIMISFGYWQTICYHMYKAHRRIQCELLL
jgi:hypothetical protein